MRKLVQKIPANAKVLVRLPNWIGDVVLCEPLLSVLAEKRPDLRLTALVKPSSAGITGLLSCFERVMVLNETGLSGTLREAARLKREAFDALLILPKGFREALLGRLSGIPVRVGFDTDRRSVLLSVPVAFTREDWYLHHSRQYGKLLEPFDLRLDDRKPELSISEEVRAKARALLSAGGVDGDFAVFHVAASKFPRAWHSRRFGEVAHRLVSEKKISCVLIGMRGEAVQHSDFLECLPSTVDLTGKTDIETMAGILAESSLFVGNDSGPMHMAAAAGTLVVAVFGPGAPGKTTPCLSNRSCRVIYADFPCSPCSQRFWRDCSPSVEGKPECLEAVSEEAVLTACIDLLG